MEQRELLRRLVEVLERLRLPYFVTGGTATIFYGEPRFTNDVDVVVDLTAADVRRLLAEFPQPEFYASEEAAFDAVRRRRQFNIIQPRLGWKADIIVPPQTAFDRSRFARARRLDVGGFEVAFASPEDAILMKLVYFRESGSDRHLRDVGGVLQVSGSEVDRGYIASWAETLGVSDVWQRVLEELATRNRR
jgi:hypothetical protein